MEASKSQAEKLYLAQKTIIKQKVKIMEFEEKNHKAKFEKIKSQNQTLFKSMDCQLDLIEMLKSENKELKLQNQNLAQDLSNVQEIKSKQESAASYELYSKKEEEVEELKEKLDEANSQIVELKLKNQNLLESQIRVLDLMNELRNFENDTKRVLEDKINEGEQQIESLNGEIVSLTNAFETEKQKQLKWAKEINGFKVENQIQKVKLATSEEICSRKKKHNQELKELLDEKDSQIDDLKLQNHDLELRNQSLQDDLFKQESKINHLKTNIVQIAKSQIDTLIAHNQTLEENQEKNVSKEEPIKNDPLADNFENLKTSLNIQNSTNLLHLACQEGLKDQVKMFLEMGAKTNIKSTGGETPLHIATKNGHWKIVQLLLQNGSDVNATNYILMTPLHCAAKYGRIEIIKILLKYGARMDLKDSDNRTPLQLAENRKKIDVIPLLK